MRARCRPASHQRAHRAHLIYTSLLLPPPFREAIHFVQLRVRRLRRGVGGGRLAVGAGGAKLAKELGIIQSLGRRLPGHPLGKPTGVDGGHIGHCTVPGAKSPAKPLDWNKRH